MDREWRDGREADGDENDDRDGEEEGDQEYDPGMSACQNLLTLYTLSCACFLFAVKPSFKKAPFLTLTPFFVNIYVDDTFGGWFSQFRSLVYVCLERLCISPCFFTFFILLTAAQVTRPIPDLDQSELVAQESSSQSQDAFLLAADQSHSTLDSVVSNGGGVQLDFSSESVKQSGDSGDDDTLPEDGIPAIHEPVVLVGIKRLVSQSTETDFSSDSESESKSEYVLCETPPSSSEQSEDTDSGTPIRTKESALTLANINVQVSEQQRSVVEEYGGRSKQVFPATTGDSDEVKVEGYSLTNSATNLQGIMSCFLHVLITCFRFILCCRNLILNFSVKLNQRDIIIKFQ